MLKRKELQKKSTIILKYPPITMSRQGNNASNDSSRHEAIMRRRELNKNK
jgi:hypothetical protein